MTDTIAIETRGLTRRFGDFKAVDGLDLAVPVGSFYGFLGPNGAGKSTTLKCLVGLLAPSEGTLRILGSDPLADPVGVKRRIGVVPEGHALLDHLTTQETLDFVAAVRGLDGATGRQRSAELLGLLDLADTGRTWVSELSHGMRKKLALAAALIGAPRLLILDEPFEGVDAVASSLIRRVLERFVAGGGTVFLTSHVLAVVEQLADHIGILDHGKLVAQGPLEALRAESPGGTLESLFLDRVGAGDEGAEGLEWLVG